jgi:hypothetical protein
MEHMPKHLAGLALACAMFAPGCASPPDVDKVPVGTEVEIVRQDGGAPAFAGCASFD